LRRHVRWIGGDAFCRDTVIACKNNDMGMVERWWVFALPRREPKDELFKPTERSGRFRELGLPCRSCLSGGFVRARKVRQ